jgi:hypothetical protein
LILLLNTHEMFSQNIFPGLTGQELLDSLTANYKTSTVLSYDDARDTLFAKIYAINDSLRAVYSGYTIYLDPTQDPTQDAYSKGIDTEHTYPRSKGATGQAESDMHHMYPTRAVVNSSRGNDPFAEIPDIETDKWFRRDIVLNTIPLQLIEEYSEKDDDNFLFEPREDHKGNAARAIFYFYTMYRQKADSADPQFFDIQRNVLRQWHIADPVDSLESMRNDQIAAYQGGKKNPFILDSSLVRRAYFTSAQSVNHVENGIAGFELHQNYPNPFNPETTIIYQLSASAEVGLAVYNIMGKKVRQLVKSKQSIGEHRVLWDGADDKGKYIASGLYIYRLKAGRVVESKKMILIK